MPWVLFEDTGSNRTYGRRVVARIDQILGYPRTHDESELVRHGPPPPGGWPAVATETQTEIRRHRNDGVGAPALQGVIAINVGPIYTAIRERLVDPLDGLGKRRVREIIDDLGWVIMSDLPGQPDNWTIIAPRDGAAGSADGVPIPEGEE